MLLRFERHSKPIDQNWSSTVFLMRVLISSRPRFVFSRSLFHVHSGVLGLTLRIDITGKAFISLGFCLYLIAQLLFGFM